MKDLPGMVDQVRFHPTEDLLAASLGGVVRLWDLATGQPRWEAKAASSDALAFSPDGALIAAVGGAEVTLIDAKTGEVRARSSGEGEGQFGGLAFSPDGRRVATARGGEAKLWDVPGGGEILTLPRPAPIGDAAPSPLAALAFSPDGRRLLNVDRNGLIEVWDGGPPEDRR
jgi:WD40 repeat protein